MVFTKNRSLEDIAAKIEKLPLGKLKGKYLMVVRVDNSQFTKMWNEINEERIFLMHKFFNAFPVTSNADRLTEAARRLAKIDALLDVGCRLLKDVSDRTYDQLNIPKARLREFLKFVIDHRKKAKAVE